MTMTLEAIAASLRQVATNAGNDYKRTWAHDLAENITAAIRKRDALRAELDALKNLQYELAAQVVRAEKAEAELAALRKAIEDAPRLNITGVPPGSPCGRWIVRDTDMPESVRGKIVRLVVEG